jgi:phosphate-selective porin OprO/OprP
MKSRSVLMFGLIGVLALATRVAAQEEEAGDVNDRLDQIERTLEAWREARAEGAGGDFESRVANLEKELEAYKDLNLADPWTLRAYWKDGLRLETTNKKVQLKLGGRIQVDTAFFEEDDDLIGAVGRSEDGVEFRRARLYISGLIYDHFEFKAQYDFAGGSGGTQFKDVYLGLAKLPHVGGIRIGHYKEPFSLEELTSSKHITFMERGLANVFAPSRNVGGMLHNSYLEGRMTAAAGIFRDTDNFGDSQIDGRYNGTLRLTGLPIYENGGRQLLHIGGAYSFRNPEGDTVRFRSRPEVHLAQRYVDTLAIPADHYSLLGAEAAWVYESFSLQGEFIASLVEATNGQADPEFYSFYVMASYFLTGEHRPYKTSSAIFNNVKPNANFLDGQGGLGAWELAARYSYLDLEDAGIDGGRIHGLTAGVNWYLNPNYRITMNYVFSHVEGIDDGHAVMLRFQAAW